MAKPVAATAVKIMRLFIGQPFVILSSSKLRLTPSGSGAPAGQRRAARYARPPTQGGIMEVTPGGMAVVTFTLLDALFTRLIDKGLLDEADQVAIFTSARESLATSQDEQMREAANLLDHLYKS